MSGRRRRGRGRTRTNRASRPQDCYGRQGHAGSLDDRPAFDTTPFDSSSGGSAWDTLPTESIFDSSDCESSEAPPPDLSDWLSSAEHSALVSFLTNAPNLIPCDDEIVLAPRVASGYSGTASPPLRRVLDRSNTPGISPLKSTIASSPGRSRLSPCESSEAPSPDLPDWFSSAEHSALVSLLTNAPNLIPCDDEISLAPRVASGYSGTASPPLRRVLDRSNTPVISPLNSTIASSPGRSPLSSCESSEAPPPDLSDWRSSAEHSALVSLLTNAPNFIPCDDNISLAPRIASGYNSGTASPLLRRVLKRSTTPQISPLNSTIASSSGRSRSSSSRPSESCSPASSGPDYTISSSSGLDTSGRSPGSSGISRCADSSDSAGSHYSQFYDDSADDDDEHQPITVTTPLPPWNPHLASERLEDPNNPPPMFHPTLSNEWRTDPNISEEIRNMYDSSCSDYSGYHGIFNYGKLSEFNTQNLYDPERFAGLNDQGDYTPAYKNADCSEVFGDPQEAMARPTDDVPDKYRKEKWHYFELKKRLELFKQLGMETDLDMYKGQLERMEADPWAGDDSGGEIEVYMRGMEGDPALDEALEKMEALVSDENEGRRAFFAAMENPPPWGELDSFLLDGHFQTRIVGDDTQLEKLTSYTDPGRRAFEKAMKNPPLPCREEYADSPDDGLELMEQLVAPTNEGRGALYAAMENPPTPDDRDLELMEQLVSDENEGRRAFFAAMENPPPWGELDSFLLDGHFQTRIVGDDSQLEKLTSYTDPGRRAFEKAMENPPLPRREEYDDSPDDGLERMEQLVAPTNEGRGAFYAAMEMPSSGVAHQNDSFRSCFGGDDLEALVSPANEQRRAFLAAMLGNPSPDDMGNSSLNCSYQTCTEGNDSQLENSILNTTFTLSEGSSVYFPPDTGPDSC